jgi:folate-binding protein YgfZ
MTDLTQQYRAVREELGFIDRSETGKIVVSGADRFSWLQGMVSNDVQRIAAPHVYGPLRACVLDPTGHVLSDIALINPHKVPPGLVSILGGSEFLLIDLPRPNVARILDLFDRYLITEEVEIRDVTDMLACFSLQGPEGDTGWEQGFVATRDPLSRVDRKAAILTPTDHTGSRGVDVYFPVEAATEIQQGILEVGVPEVGPEVQEILRVEAGLPKYGVDMNETTLAPEANLMATHISLTKGCYVGQEVIARIDSRGHTNRALTGLLFPAGEAPASGDRIQALPDDDSEGRDVGWITSVVAASPAKEGRPIALGYVRHEHRAAGTALRVGPRALTAEATELPFYHKVVDMIPVDV